MPNTRLIDMLISYYANMPLCVNPGWGRSFWDEHNCLGAVLLFFKNRNDKTMIFIGSIAAELEISHAVASSLFFMTEVTSLPDPTGTIIKILEHVRDTGEFPHGILTVQSTVEWAK